MGHGRPPRATVRIRVSIKPKSHRPGISSQAGELCLSVRSAPLEGRANDEAIAQIARVFGVPKSRVRLVRGARGRRKLFEISDPQVVPPDLEQHCLPGDPAP